MDSMQTHTSQNSIDEQPYPPERINFERLVGGALVFVGLLFGYFGVVRPLQGAINHVPSIWIEKKAVFVAPFMLLYGSLPLSCPRFFIKNMGGTQNRLPETKVGWTIFVVVLIVSFAFEMWFESQLRIYGYTV